MRRRSSQRFMRLLAFGLWLPTGFGVPVVAEGAPPPARGFPLIREVIPTVPEAEVQNFGVATDRRGLVYVANLGGLLIYDGAWWRALAIGKAKAAFSVTTD